MFDQNLLWEVGLTPEEAELVEVVHPYFWGLKRAVAAAYLGISKRTLYRKLAKLYVKFPHLKVSLDQCKEDAKDTRVRLKNAKRFGNIPCPICSKNGNKNKDLEMADDFKVMGERIVRIF